MTAYDEWVDFKADNGGSNSKIASFIDEKTNEFWDYLPKDEKDPIGGSGYSFTHFAKSFYNAKNRVHFLDLMLTTDRCKGNRSNFNNRELFSANYYKKNYDSKLLYKTEKMGLIKKAFALKRSSIVILYADSPTHAAVVTGMRMQDGVCQLYLRSSMEEWGSFLVSGWYSDWYNADYILESALAIKYLKEVTTEDYESDKKIFLQKDIASSYAQEDLYNDPSKW